MSRVQSQWWWPVETWSGPGSAAGLPHILDRWQARRILLVVDRGVVGAGIAARIIDLLESSGRRWRLFDRPETSPREKTLRDGVVSLRELGADAIVAVGGGSVIDAAKALNLLAYHPGPVERYAAAVGGSERIEPVRLPLVAIPTTAGTGSEFLPSASVVSDTTGRRTVLSGRPLWPSAVILDAELTLGLPPFMTAATGFDALTHGLEALVSTEADPLSSAVATAAVERIFRSLPRAVEDGSHDVEARQDMLVAAALGGLAAQAGLGAAHALSHALGPLAGLHHGLACALVLPAVLDFHSDCCAHVYRGIEHRLDLGVAAGEDAGDVVGIRGVPLAERVRWLKARLGLSGGLSSHGVRPEQWRTLAEYAATDAALAHTPRPASVDDLYRMLEVSS